MKKVLALFLVLVMVLGLAACGKGKDKDPNLIEIGDYQALYQGAWITKDYDGNDTIVVPFTFTNNSDETTSFMWAMFYTLTQGGIGLEVSTVFVSEDSFDTLSDDVLTDVAPGASLDLAITYQLNNLTDPVLIEFSDLFDKNKDELTIDVAALEVKSPDAGNASGGDAPDEGNAPAASNGPTAVFDEYEVTFVEGEITLDSEGRTTLVISYDYTNKDTGDNSYGWSVYDTGYQDGAVLDTTDIYLEDGTALRDTHYKEVPQGETLRTYEMYLINDVTTPVEVQFTDLFETKVETITIDLTTLPNNAGSGEEEPEEDPGEEPEDGGDQVPVNIGYPFAADIAEAYAGDWHGMAEFYDCTGDYSDEDGMQCEIVARFVFDENGYCTPYIRLCLDVKEERNFAIDSMEYDEEYNCMLINGSLLNLPLDPIDSYAELLEDTLYIGASHYESDNVFNVIGCLRRLDDTWDYDVDYPALPEAGVDFYMGMSFEEIVDLYGYDVGLIPSLDGGSTSSGGAELEIPELPFETGIEFGDGVVSLQELKDFKNWLDSVNSYENDYYKPTHEEMVEQMGVNPYPSRPEKWVDSEKMAYYWTTPDNKDFVTITVQPAEDGSGWIYHAISWTSGVNG